MVVVRAEQGVKAVVCDPNGFLGGTEGGSWLNTQKFVQNDRPLHVLPPHTGDLPLITQTRRMYDYHTTNPADYPHEQRLYA